MNWFRQASISVVLATTVVLGLLLPAIGIGYYSLRDQHNFLAQSLEYDFDRTKTLILKDIAQTLWFETPHLAEPLLQSVFEDKRVITLIVRNQDGQQFIGRTIEGRSYPKELRKTFPIIFKSEEFGDRGQIGTMELAMSKRELDEQSQRTALFLLAIMLVQIAVSAAVILPVIRNKVSRPLKRLVKDADKLSAKRLEEPFAWNPGDEVSQLGIALENARASLIRLFDEEVQRARLEKDLCAAKAVQEALLAPLPEIKQLEMAAYYQAAEQTGGDWYGVYQSSDHRYLFAWVGDVTGHGIPAALVTAVASGGLYAGERRYEMSQKVGPIEVRLQEMAQNINAILFETGRRERLMTMLFLALDLDQGQLYYLNAGHNFPLLYSVARQKAIKLVNSGSALGFTPNPKFEVKSRQLVNGDMILAFTDGLVENVGPNKDVLSERTIKQWMVKDTDPKKLVDHVVQSGKEVWRDQPAEDDVTMLAIRWIGHATAQRAS